MHRQARSHLARSKSGWRGQRRTLSRQASKSLTGIGAAFVLVGFAALGETNGEVKQAVDPIELSSVARNGSAAAPNPVALEAMPLKICGSGRRSNCIVDGDTFWLKGAKYRIANIDTPELKGKCSAEHTAAERARDRLGELMSAGPVELTKTGTDRFGRTLVLVSGPDGDLGEKLVSERLAEVWGGAFIDWCSG